MRTYTAETVHNENTITRLAKTQYLTFSSGVRFAAIVVCMIFIMLALFGHFSQGVTIILLVLGCLPFTAINQPAKQTAEDALEAMKGNFPTNQYAFEPDGMHVRNGERSEVVKYANIVRLVTDDAYAYLFLRNRSGYMVALASIRPADVKGFEADVAEQVGLKWTRNKALLNTSVRGLLFNRKNMRK